ncbi:EIN3-binding F-box protein 1 [Cryptomeria japonica]|uniref:EIN3-binding F-box protein 1 n=1 Tax=Cryptomeria japonica TaxID=3369 RepID=UPI0027DAA8FD|nr:EIN3-binding F-box protein 1 [Cryptomeria japonica]
MLTPFKRACDEDFYIRGPKNSSRLEFCGFLPVSSCMEISCHPRKKSRHNASLLQGESNFKRDAKDLINMLPDECLLEIFRWLPGPKDRSVCAGVSKHWLMLQSSFSRTELKYRSQPFPKPFGESLSVNSNKIAKPGAANLDDESNDDCSGAAAEEEGIIDADIDRKGVTQKGMSKKQSVQATGDLTRCLEGKKANDIRLAAIAVCTGGCGGLGKLLIRGDISCQGVTDVGLAAIGLGCPGLRVLSLWNCPFISDKGLAAIAKGCRLLEKLDLFQCPWIGDNGLESVALNCPNLLNLNLESCPSVGDKSLKAVGQNCVKLKSLRISNCSLVSDEGIITILSKANSLMKAKFQALRLTDISLAALGHYGKSLTDLSLENLNNVTEKGFWSLGNAMGLQKLKHFSVSACRGLSDASTDAVGLGCLSLKQFSIRKCESITDKGLTALSHSVMSLENLRIEECNLISSFGVMDVLSNCSGKLKVLSLIKCEGVKDQAQFSRPFPVCESLKSLNICHCPGVGNGFLALLGNACPQFEELDLSGLSGISDEGLLALLQSSKRSLVKVNLSGCVQVTDWAVYAIASLCGENLHTLNLEGCRKVTDQSLKVIADLCPALEDLDLAKCGITDNGVVSLVSARQQAIQILSLSGCMQITDKCLPFIEKMSKTLLGLNLQHCNGLSQTALDTVGAHLWRCDLLVS